MTKGRGEVITSVERRRRFSSAEKQQLVSASLEPGASVSAVAREAGIHPGQLYGWGGRVGGPPRGGGGAGSGGGAGASPGPFLWVAGAVRCRAADRVCAGSDRAGSHASRCG